MTFASFAGRWVASFLLCLIIAGCHSHKEEVELPIPLKTIPPTFSYADWQKFLSEAVTPDGYIRWNDVRTDEATIRRPLLKFVGLINAVSPRNHDDMFATENDKLAYWINAYNAMVVYAVIEHKYPGNMLVGQPEGAIFSTEKFTFGGEQMTLDELIHREFAKADARVYFALTLCTMSSPPLRSEAYDGAVLDAQLVDQGQRYLNDPRAVVRNGDTAELNDLLYSIHKEQFIDQFQKTIGHPATGILEALQPYALGDSPLVGATKAGELGFDWSLNRPPR